MAPRFGLFEIRIAVLFGSGDDVLFRQLGVLQRDVEAVLLSIFERGDVFGVFEIGRWEFKRLLVVLGQVREQRKQDGIASTTSFWDIESRCFRL
jgi:hypothetical protein